MTDLRLVVTGAAGRMGRMLIREFEAMRERVFELIDGELAARLQHEIQRVRREG